MPGSLIPEKDRIPTAPKISAGKMNIFFGSSYNDVLILS